MTDPYDNVRAAFREVTLGLMEWADPPIMGRREYAARELLEPRVVYRPWDPQGDVEPFNVQADWDERA